MTHSLRRSILVVLTCGAPFQAATQAPPDSKAEHPVRLRFYDAGKWGYLDASGAVVIPPQFTNAMDYFREGFARVQFGSNDTGKWTFLHWSGRALGAARFDAAMDFQQGLAADRVGEKWGVVDTSGSFVLEPQFDLPVHFFQKRAELRIDGKTGFIDTRGAVVIAPQFASAFGWG